MRLAASEPETEQSPEKGADAFGGAWGAWGGFRV